MKKVVFGLLACVTLLSVSCEPNNLAEEDAIYEEGVDRTKIRTTNRKSVDLSKVEITNNVAVDRTKIRTSNRKEDQ
ncbi:MAG: hypothetical protein HKN31_13665 [Pricia sp.]|nr:hypothetical protein [Pricia sp.]